jgi:hypothetical protein
MPVRPRKISDIRPLFGNLAQTSHYEVKFGGLPPQLTSYLLRKGITSRFIAEDAGLLCYSAILPTTQLSTADISDNYMGITETFAHRRLYSDITLQFYVDSNYNTLKFLEYWMEFISSGASNPIDSNNEPINSNVDTGYFIRMQYPEFYKSNRTTIVKFDRNYYKELTYTFIGLYPYNIGPPAVAYNQSDILKVQVNFKIDRYVIGRASSLDIATQSNDSPQPPPTVPTPPPTTSTPPANRPILWPRSPGSVPSNGVELVPANKTLTEYLYGSTNK